MIDQIVALLALGLLLWTIFRFSMGLRWAKVSREDARAAEQARGRRVVAEIPLSNEEIVFFVEDEDGFYWGGRQVRKRDVRGARLLLNGGVMVGVSRDGERLPEPDAFEPQLPRATDSFRREGRGGGGARRSAPPFDEEGRERWEVLLFMDAGRTERIACGTLREGVSREIAGRVFEAVRSAVRPGKERA
jgi:hypothetical protein